MTKLDCSDGAKMLIERMQTNPEDFNYGGKLYKVMDQSHMSARDMRAFSDAHDLYIKEPALMGSVLQALLAQPVAKEKNEVIAARAYQAGLGVRVGGILQAEQRTLSDVYNKAFGREKVERDN
jgi:hypothetical protein